MLLKVFKCFCSLWLIIHGLSAVIFVTDFLHPFAELYMPHSPFLGVQEVLIQSACITLTQEHLCVSSSTKGQKCQGGCDLYPVFPHLDGYIIDLIYFRSRWLRNRSDHFTKSSASLWFTLFVTPWVQCDTCRFLATNDAAARAIWGVLKLRDHLGNLPPLL